MLRHAYSICTSCADKSLGEHVGHHSNNREQHFSHPLQQKGSLNMSGRGDLEGRPFRHLFSSLRPAQAVLFGNATSSMPDDEFLPTFCTKSTILRNT